MKFRDGDSRSLLGGSSPHLLILTRTRVVVKTALAGRSDEIVGREEEERDGMFSFFDLASSLI